MKALVLLPIATALSFAQDLPAVIRQGEAAFTKTCGSGYCHGSAGAGGGAPRLAARGFDQDYIRAKVTNGVKDTQMAAYGQSLSAPELTAVVAYVATLNGITNPSIGSPTPGGTRAQETLSADAARGKALFSEAVRGFARCSTCHEVNGIGIAVAPPVTRVPASAAELKGLATPTVSTATAEGANMPILMVARRSQDVLFYDLTTPPPVLRTFAPSEVQIADGSSWRHSTVLGKYSDAELNAILAYFRAVAPRE
jgi:mono/diheme cytochrome c family protein